MLQTSSIERVCNQADDAILETAAVSSPPPHGGPELLAVFVVLKEGISAKPEVLRMKFSKAIRSNLNPLFKVFVDFPDSVFSVLCSFLVTTFLGALLI